MVKVLHENEELVNHTGSKVIWDVGQNTPDQDTPDLRKTLPTEVWKVITQ